MSRPRRRAVLLLTAGLLTAGVTTAETFVASGEAEATTRRSRRAVRARASRAAVRTSQLRAVAARDPFGALALCESGGNPQAVSRSGRYRGSFQFDQRTWESVGMTGDPVDHPHEVQLEAAHRLQAARGWAPWPSCSRRLGLR